MISLTSAPEPVGDHRPAAPRVQRVVSQITEGTAFDRRGMPFRRRNVVPGVIAVVAALVLTAIVWAAALTRPVEVVEAVECNSPPAAPDAPGLGERVSSSTMTDVSPAPLAETQVRVLNASGQAGQAAEVSGALRDVGFPAPTADNDPVYANTRLDCQGQIRFGENGIRQAAAVWLVAPCAELFRDGREDATVDLAIGTDFTGAAHSDDIEAVLAGLRPDAAEPADPSLVRKAHAGAC